MRNRRKINSLSLSVGERYVMRRMNSLSSTTGCKVTAYTEFCSELEGAESEQPRREMILLNHTPGSDPKQIEKLRTNYITSVFIESNQEIHKNYCRKIASLPQTDATFLVAEQCHVHEKILQTILLDLNHSPGENSFIELGGWGVLEEVKADPTPKEIAKQSKEFLKKISATKKVRQEHLAFIKCLKSLRQHDVKYPLSVTFADGVLVGHSLIIEASLQAISASLMEASKQASLFGLIINQLDQSTTQVIMVTRAHATEHQQTSPCLVAILSDRSVYQQNAKELEEVG